MPLLMMTIHLVTAEARLKQVTRGAAPLSGIEVEEMEQVDEELW